MGVWVELPGTDHAVLGPCPLLERCALPWPALIPPNPQPLSALCRTTSDVWEECDCGKSWAQRRSDGCAYRTGIALLPQPGNVHGTVMSLDPRLKPCAAASGMLFASWYSTVRYKSASCPPGAAQRPSILSLAFGTGLDFSGLSPLASNTTSFGEGRRVSQEVWWQGALKILVGYPDGRCQVDHVVGYGRTITLATHCSLGPCDTNFGKISGTSENNAT